MITGSLSTPGELFTFSTLVMVDGYALSLESAAPTAAPTTTSEFLTAGLKVREFVPVGVDKEWRYPLRECPNIAREFAATRSGENEVLGFVNRWGLLFPAGDHRNTLEAFNSARAAVQATVRRINAAQRKSEGLPVDEQRSALRAVAAWFNPRAAASFSYRLRLPISATAAPGVRVEPNSLMSAIGLWLAYEISGEIGRKTCANCGSRFPVGGGLRRRDAETCSQTCTQALLDARKAAAKPGRAALAPRACAHCGDQYTPKRATTMHCGKPACAMGLSRLNTKGGSK